MGVAHLWLLPSPHQTSSVQTSSLPLSLHKVCVAWAQVPVLQSDLVSVTQTHQWSPFYLLLGAYVGPDYGSANCALSPRLPLLSFSEGPESTEGSTPGLQGTSGNHQHPSLPPLPLLSLPPPVYLVFLWGM